MTEITERIAVEAALAQIDAFTRGYEKLVNGWSHPGLAPRDQRFILDVLRGDREILEEHTPGKPHWRGETICSNHAQDYGNAGEWPCSDVARVLARYAAFTSAPGPADG